MLVSVGQNPKKFCHPIIRQKHWGFCSDKTCYAIGIGESHILTGGIFNANLTSTRSVSVILVEYFDVEFTRFFNCSVLRMPINNDDFIRL